MLEKQGACDCVCGCYSFKGLFLSSSMKYFFYVVLKSYIHIHLCFMDSCSYPTRPLYNFFSFFLFFFLHRRCRLSKLFNRIGSKHGYGRIRRDQREDERQQHQINGGFHGVSSSARISAASGSIELFDSKNYAGPTTGKFF